MSYLQVCHHPVEIDETVLLVVYLVDDVEVEPHGQQFPQQDLIQSVLHHHHQIELFLEVLQHDAQLSLDVETLQEVLLTQIALLLFVDLEGVVADESIEVEYQHHLPSAVDTLAGVTLLYLAGVTLALFYELKLIPPALLDHLEG